MSNIQHSSRTDQWGTPLEIIEPTRKVLGEIDLDPASSKLANQNVKAKIYINEKENGLVGLWGCNPMSIFINPPSGKYKGTGKTKLFWEKLIYHHDKNLVKHAIFLGFSLEQLAILQDCHKNPLHFCVCFPRKRIKFINLQNPNHKDRPTHSNFICYIPGIIDDRNVFYKEFHKFGHITGIY